MVDSVGVCFSAGPRAGVPMVSSFFKSPLCLSQAHKGQSFDHQTPGMGNFMQSDTPDVHRPPAHQRHVHTGGGVGPSQSPAPTASVLFSNSLPPLEGLWRAVLLSSLCPAWMVTSLRDLGLHVQQSQLLCSSDRRAEGLHLLPPQKRG